MLSVLADLPRLTGAARDSCSGSALPLLRYLRVSRWQRLTEPAGEGTFQERVKAQSPREGVRRVACRADRGTGCLTRQEPSGIGEGWLESAGGPDELGGVKVCGTGWRNRCRAVRGTLHRRSTRTCAVRLAPSVGGRNSVNAILSEDTDCVRALTLQLGKDGGREDTRSSEGWPFCTIAGDFSICKRWVCIYFQGVFVSLINQAEVQMKRKQLGYARVVAESDFCLLLCSGLADPHLLLMKEMVTSVFDLSLGLPVCLPFRERK